MPTQENIATALMSVELPNGEISGLMLEMADVRTPVHMPTPPAADSVEKVMSKGWAKVATAVLSGTKEFLGPRLLKHTSIQVRRLLADHGTDEETLRRLHDWALTKDDETLTSLSRRIDPLWLLAKVEQGAPYPNRILATIAHRAVDADPDSLDRILHLEPEKRLVMLLCLSSKIAAGDMPKCSLSRALMSLEPAAQSTLARHLCTSFSGTLTEDLLDQFLSLETSAREAVQHGFRSASAYEASAARTLVSKNPDLALFVLATDWDQELFDQFIGLNRFSVMDAMLSSERIVRFTRDELSTAIMAADTSERSDRHYRPPLLNRDLLGLVSYELDTETLLAYLRNTDSQATWKWLNGSYGQKPRPGEPSALVADRGFAFGHSLVPTTGAYVYSSVPTEDVAAMMANQFTHLVDKPWCDELVDACGPAAFAELLRAHDQSARPYLVSRFTRELGADKELWRAAIAQFSTSKLSIGKTLSSARRLSTAR